MKKFFNWILVLAGCVGLFYCIGLIVPRSLTLGCRTNLTTKPEQVYALVSDLETWPEWHPDVRKVQESVSRGDTPLWRVTDSNGESYDLEVNSAEEDAAFQVAYTIDGSRYTLRFSMRWYGEGARVQLARTVDTRDPWKRAKSFLWSRNETKPVGLLNALVAHLGEAAPVEEE